MATTTNFGWETPDDTDLVKDGAAAIRTALGGVDTSFVDLKGGTTGQILSKASNTDLDYTWISAAPGDITGVSVTSPITGGGTSGDVTIGISTSAVVPSQTGNSGKYLTTDGTTASWGTISSGGMTLLSTTSMSGSSQVNITSINQTYKDLIILINMVSWNTSDSEIQLRFNAANNSWGAGFFGGTSGDFAADAIKMTLGNNTSYVNTQTHCVTLKNYASTTATKPFVFSGNAVTTTGTRRGTTGGGSCVSTSAVTSLRFETAHGNTFNAGEILLYGAN